MGRKEIEVEIIDIQQSKNGSYVCIRLPDGREDKMFIAWTDDFERAVMEHVRLLKLIEELREKKSQEHLSYRGKKIKVVV